jgi:hypothetical protein
MSVLVSERVIMAHTLFGRRIRIVKHMETRFFLHMYLNVFLCINEDNQTYHAGTIAVGIMFV